MCFNTCTSGGDVGPSGGTECPVPPTTSGGEISTSPLVFICECWISGHDTPLSKNKNKIVPIWENNYAVYNAKTYITIIRILNTQQNTVGIKLRMILIDYIFLILRFKLFETVFER